MRLPPGPIWWFPITTRWTPRWPGSPGFFPEPSTIRLSSLQMPEGGGPGGRHPGPDLPPPDPRRPGHQRFRSGRLRSGGRRAEPVGDVRGRLAADADRAGDRPRPLGRGSVWRPGGAQLVRARPDDQRDVHVDEPEVL